MKLRLRRRAVLADLSRPRIGLTDEQIAVSRRPKERLLVMAGAVGLAPVHRNDGRGLEPRPSHPHEEGTLSEHSAA